ncbi:CBS domain-containing protein [Ahrensia sp. R2A130]|uniref:CBS domain-containing protein n=1 Tax=Ahrensia sp. R2A130 TaxID=744979 RepID=UPI0001E0F88E|nr:CBS domain-containing protein [Ahrensia sp. R2A130]EFL89219.1 signal-transduction protein [Ahrensia sp. R2A130]
MTVAMMLDAKGHNTVTISQSETLADAATILADRRIGAILAVDENGKMTGILSERDIIKFLAKDGAAALEKQISACMTRNVVTCQRRDTIDAVRTMMGEGRFRHVPVMEDGELAGIISVSDVVKHRMAQVSREAEELKRYIMDGAA